MSDEGVDPDVCGADLGGVVENVETDWKKVKFNYFKFFNIFLACNS